MSLPPDAKDFVEQEVSTLEGVVDSLKKQRDYGNERLHTELERARTLTSRMVATRRVEDRAMLASDEAVSHALSEKKQIELKNIGKLIEKPYFARIMLEESDEAGRTKTIEYKLGTAANPDCRIIDWRKAPISKLYYEYKEGDEYSEEILGRERNGKVLLRNTLEIERSSLRRITCRHGNLVRQGDQWVRQGETVRSRAASSSGELPGILALITEDQFRTITEEADTAILIQGIAGSGKTTVALHRLAWLLHEDNSDLQAEECAIVVFSNALKKYVSGTLPSLGVSGVRVLTYPEWCARTIGAVARQYMESGGSLRRPLDRCPLGIDRVKRSMAMLTALESYATDERRQIIEELANGLPWDDMPMHARKNFDSLLQNNAPVAQLLKDLAVSINEVLVTGNTGDLGALYAALCIVEERLKKIHNYEDDLIAILEQPGRILDHDETRLMDRDLIREALERTERNKEECVLDPADDALFVRLCQLRTGAPFLADGKPGKYGHLVVDEVQDFGPTELASVVGAVKESRNLTLVGDTAQKIDESSAFPGWEKLRKHWGFKDSMARFMSLTVSHRSTVQIMRLADHVQGKEIVKSGRDGRPPIWFKASTESKGLSAIIKWLTIALERYPDALSAVICQDEKEAKYALSLLAPTFGPSVRIGDSHSFSFEQGIVVTDIKQVKGLEFYNVVLWNPNAKCLPANDLSRNLLYVAITRAEENLCIVTWSKPCELLPAHSSKLVRGMHVSEEEGG